MTNQPDQPARDAGSGAAGSGTARSGTAGSGTAGTGTARTSAGAAAPPSEATRQGDARRQGTAARPNVPRQSQPYETSYAESGPSGATLGFTLLAAALMMISGVLGFFEGLAAIIRSSWFIVSRNYAFDMSAVGWGWIHLILGVLIAIAGVALLRDMLWARITGIVIASLVTIANFLFIPYYPVWSIVVIALNLFIIWALLAPRHEF